MSKFRKKPVVIEAFLWTGDFEQKEDPKWASQAIADGIVSFINSGTPDVKLAIKMLEGTMLANRGDYIVQGVNGELCPYKPEIFEKTYEPAENVDIPMTDTLAHAKDLIKVHGAVTGLCRDYIAVQKRLDEAIDVINGLGYPISRPVYYTDHVEQACREILKRIGVSE